MKKAAILGSLVLVMIPLLAASEDVKRTTALEFSSSLFSSSLSAQATREGRAWPEVFMVANIHGFGLGKDASSIRENLRRFFNLPDLELVHVSPAAKIAWESGTWRDYKEHHPRAVQVVRLDDQDYTVSLIPHEIDVGRRVFKFILEISRSSGPGVFNELRSSERIVEREILWDFGGPLAVGFYFPERVYFLSWTIGIEMSVFGFRFGSGLTWIL